MKLRRSDFAYDFGVQVVRAFDNVAFAPRYVGIENIPRAGPALFVPRHISETDIPLEAGLLYPRRGNWVMKGSLPKALELIGGVGITRKKDVLKVASQIEVIQSRQQVRAQKRRMVAEGREQNDEVLRYLKFLYNIGEVVFVHPEGTKSPNHLGKDLKMDLLYHAMECSRDLGPHIPIIPVGIAYGEKRAFEVPYSKGKRFKVRQEVVLSVGQEIPYDHPDLKGTLRERLEELSVFRE
jgi:1-acyl-sn-glycerol-3-phosphate acyltransferase